MAVKYTRAAPLKTRVQQVHSDAQKTHHMKPKAATNAEGKKGVGKK